MTQTALTIQDALASGERMVAHVVENQVVTLPTLREIFTRVIHNAIGADPSDHVQILGAADPSHLGTEPLGDLHCERAYATRGSLNQNLCAL
jgi:hypothetical protein